MVDYSNPQPPEGINASNDNPIKELILLGAGILAVLGLLFLIISFSAAWLASKVPFEYEERIGDQVFGDVAEFPHSESMQTLADRIAQAMSLPPDIHIQVHYNEEDTVNAFAFLGGHIVIYQGLLDRLESENALAMVLAHEIAHVQHRDVAKSLGRGLAVALVSGIIFGNSDGVAGRIINSGIHTGLLSFSRDQESEADAAAIQAVYRLYGHTQGAFQLYDALQAEMEQQGGIFQVEFLSTHPLTATRIQTLHELVATQGWPQQGPLSPLPIFDSQ